MSLEYVTDMGDQTIDVSANTRKFQTSLVIKQDLNKSGILSVLQKVEADIPPPPTREAPKTLTPSAPASGY